MKLATTVAAASLLLSLAACTSSDDGKSTDGGKSTPAQQQSVVTYAAEYPAYDSAESLSEAADLIVEGTVVSSTVREIDIALPAGEGGGDPGADPGEGAKDADEEAVYVYTVYDVEVTSVHKGTAEPGQTIEVKQLGGTLDGVEYVENDTVPFTEGASHVLFLSTSVNPDVPHSLLTPVQSAYLKDGRELRSVHPDNQLAMTSGELADLTGR